MRKHMLKHGLGMCLKHARAMHVRTNATNATHARKPRPDETRLVLNPSTPVDNPKFGRSEVEK